MNTKNAPLSPTVWRTCRAIANGNRLRCLKAVLQKPDATVEEIAGTVGLSEPQASLALRSIQSRGLIASRRQSRWVRYSPDPDKSVQTATAFLTALKSALFTEKLSEKRIRHALTAYTHPRRITLVRALAGTATDQLAALSTQTDISLPALHRHLKHLMERGVIENENNRYALAVPKDRLSQELLLIVLD